MNITAAMVKALRDKTGAGMMECKQALTDAEGDAAKAELLLRERGAAKAEKRMGRAAREGRIEVYMHHDNKGAAMVEVDCETDFVARTEDFQELCRNIAMHVYATSPRWVRQEDIPEDALTQERNVFRTLGESEGKKGKGLDGFVEGQVKNFIEQNCLLEQVFIKDMVKPRNERQTVGDLVKEMVSKLGENIVIGRFVRFRVGEE